jgi:hypothetical protein
MGAAVGVLVVCAMLPARWMRWANALGSRAAMVIAPVKGPAWALVNWLSPTEVAKPEAIKLLENDRDRWKWLYQQKADEFDDWVRKIEKQIGKGAIYSDLPVKPLLRRVIGPASEGGGLIQVRAGSRDGVDTSAVATTDGVQLVGKVASVANRTCSVRLITDMSAGLIDGYIMTSDLERGPVCKGLAPVGGQKLQTRVRVDTERKQKPPEIGQLVRLVDDQWPRSAQMLIIGTIADKPVQDSTGWYVVTVKPTVDLERLMEVLLRIPVPETEERPSPSTDGSKP